MECELLKRAAEIIQEIPTEQLDLRYWTDGAPSVIEETLDCGTICCAAGWLSLHPEMQALGLTLAKGDYGTIAPMLAPHGAEGFSALSILFDISYDEASALFGPPIFSETNRYGEDHKAAWRSRVELLLADRAEFNRKYVDKEGVMSYDIYIVDKTGAVMQADKQHLLRGGTFAAGGTTELWLNVTYNYSGIIGKVLDGGLRSLDGKTVAETLTTLAYAAGKLGEDEDPDYWKPTEGNARRALLDLIALGSKAVTGTWRVS